MKITVSCIQMYPRLGDKEYNLQKIEDSIKKTMEEHPKTNLIVLPELATTGYEGTPEMFEELAEEIPSGESMKRIGKLAAEYGVYVVYGFAERSTEQKSVLYNSALLIDREGKAAGVYRKVHPFADEKRWCRAGCELPVFDTEFGKIGIMICWDTAFPEVAKAFAIKGADLLVVSTNWEDPYDDEVWNTDSINTHEEDWDLMTSARALDNTLHLVAANRIGDDGGTLSFFGRSKILDPRGREIAALNSRQEGIISAEIDLSRTQMERAKYYCFLKDRRPDVYGEIVKEY